MGISIAILLGIMAVMIAVLHKKACRAASSMVENRYRRELESVQNTLGDREQIIYSWRLFSSRTIPQVLLH